MRESEFLNRVELNRVARGESPSQAPNDTGTVHSRLTYKIT